MAIIEEYTPGRYRVRYSLRIPGKTTRRYRYASSRVQANALLRQLAFLEDAVTAGAAPVADVDEWIGRGWITREQALTSFRAYRAHGNQTESNAPVDFVALEREYEGYALEHSKARDATRKSHRNHMNLARQVLAWLSANHTNLALTPQDVTTWVSSLASQGYSDWSRHHYLQKLRILLDLAERLGMAKGNAARAVRRALPKTQTRRQILTPAEALLLLDRSLAHRSLVNGGLPTVVRLGLYAGLRPEEMCWLTWGSVDLKRRLIHVQETMDTGGQRWRPKDAEMRVIDVKPEAVAYLEAERDRQEVAGLLGPFILVSGHEKMTQYRGRPINSDTIQHAFVKMARAEGMGQHITLYTLRHTYCTSLLRAGVDIETVRERMGHSDIRTTQGYLHALRPESHPSDVLPY